MGATQANLTVIDAALKPWQGVLCADSGHIHVHETGAVEATGHKCLVLAGTNGKITAAQIEAAVTAHRANPTHEHEVQPGMVYISNPTEWGTLYSKEELQAISQACRTLGLYLFVDGARMAYALASPANDVTLPDFAALCDAFYLGGTKCGALFGKALVLTNPALDQDFRYALKQHGGMLAKGRLLGLQFLALLGEAGDLSRRLIISWPPGPTPWQRRFVTPLPKKDAGCYTVPHQSAVSDHTGSLGCQVGAAVQFFADGPAGNRPAHGALLHKLGYQGPGCRIAACRHRLFVIYLYAIKNMLFVRCTAQGFGLTGEDG